MTTQKDYEALCKLSKHTQILKGVLSLLDWDQETYMPSGAADIRAQQVKTLAGLIHREKTGRKFVNALSKLVDLKSGKILDKKLSPSQQSALKEWRRNYLHDTALPSSFVEEFSKTTSQSINAWRYAKKTNSFEQFAPFLDKIITLCRKKVDYLGYKNHPYDALIDEYEPDVKTEEIEAIFSTLRNQLTPMIKKIAKQPVDNRFLFGEWDHAKQIAFSEKLLEALGYDKNHGRLDFSAHPFSSSSHPTDSRITTRIHPSSLMSNIFAVLHEAGHALYEMGLPQNQYGTPLGESRSLGIHESQSRWWETRIGLSKPFWHYFFPLLKETFKGQLEHVNLDVFYKAINKVQPSFIRIEADELTYPLHVILRFELEKGLIEGSLNVRDIPEVWNAKMEEYLGIIPANNAEGCLQDIHWSMGAFGYFPTYTLGNLYAAHLFEAFSEEYPKWEKEVEAGEFGFIKTWLYEKIYQHGKQFSTQELLLKATNQPFSPNAYLSYLKKKYSSLYKI